MSLVDWVLIGAVIVFAWAGWRQGFVAGLLSFAGFLGGGLLAAFLLPDVISSRVSEGVMRAVILIGAILLSALLGQGLTSILGRWLRDAITWRPARLVDNILGAALNVLALAVMTWILASAIAMLPRTEATSMIQQSKVVTTLDGLVPDQVRDAFVHLRDAVGEGALPRVFSTLAEIVGPEVPAPDDSLVNAPVIQQSASSVARIVGIAADCSTSLSGSGFFVGQGFLLTNAHVVAGVTNPEVQVGNQRWPASVVYFDPQLDVAALKIDVISVPPLALRTSPPASGSDAVAIGYPGGGDLQILPARIRALVDARGDDIYGKSGVQRQVITFKGNVIQGDSGGPLLAPDGAVLGMVFGSGIGDATTGFAIASSELKPAIIEGSSAQKPVSTGTCVLRD
ncbi:MAG: MarP family serine protease [Actinomycetota bacterium]|nr:MarP family serine protease [Actinomycetota bacterium]MDP2287563.1 MarP family serine protease [Actinomycetota bacterium]